MGDVTDRRSLAVAPERLWQAFTTSEGLLGWFWPPKLGPSIGVDARAGGHYRIASQVTGMAVSGQYTQVREPSLLSFSWQWDGEDTRSSVTVEFAPADGGTQLTVTHHGLTGTEQDNHVQGWSDCLDRLPDWLAR